MKKNFTKLLCILMASLLLWVPLAVSAYPGNINDDSRVNTADYVLLKKYVMGQIELDYQELYAADYNLDGTVNTADYVLLKRYVMETYTPDMDWLHKDYKDMTDEELKKAINHELSYPHMAGEVIIDFAQGVSEEEASEILCSFDIPFQTEDGFRWFGSDKLWTCVKVEEEQLRDLIFRLNRHEKVLLSIPNGIEEMD